MSLWLKDRARDSQVRNRLLKVLRRRIRRRELRLEPLEERQLLANPQLGSIQPNAGEILQQDDVRNVAPRQLTFGFDENQVIDAGTLAGIRVVRSGTDGEFASASAVSDLGTGGLVYVHFSAVQPGLAGNGLAIILERQNLGPAEPPHVSLDGNTLRVELNEAAGDESTAQGLVDVINNDPVVRQIFRATVLDNFVGRESSPGTDITSSLTGELEIVVDNANAAKAYLGVVGDPDAPSQNVQIQFASVRSGASGNGITVQFDFHDPTAGPGRSPTVSVDGQMITVELDTSPDFVVSAGELTDLINDDSEAGNLIQASIVGGNRDLAINAAAAFVGTEDGTNRLVLRDTDLKAAPGEAVEIVSVDPGFDVDIVPGFIGVNPDRQNEVILRFAESLPDDKYRIDVFGEQSVSVGPGSGERPIPLLNVSGESFDADPDTEVNEHFHLRFDLNLGAQIVAVVPQPIVGSGDDATQLKNTIHVYFNDDDLWNEAVSSADAGSELPSVVNPSFYRLLHTNSDYNSSSVTNTDDSEFIPIAVEYDPAADRAILTFHQDVNTGFDQLLIEDPNAPGSMIPVGPGVFRLRIGTNEPKPLPPTTPADIDPGSSFETAQPVELGGTAQSVVISSELSDDDEIDMYRFELPERGLLTAETFQLDTVLTLYQQSGGKYTTIARNDDYVDDNSRLKLELDAGIYYVGLSSTGNLLYDPIVEDTGSNGGASGPYDLRLTFRAEADMSITDVDEIGGAVAGTALDGDADGNPGGVFDFWFRAGVTTWFVDKLSESAQPDGSVENPYRSFTSAFQAAQPGDIVRVVGSAPNFDSDGFVDRTKFVGPTAAESYETATYQFGIAPNGQPLPDGSSLKIPRGVTVMVDSGVVFKFRRSLIEVGSSAPLVDRSGGALQILGTPKVIDADGKVVRDTAGNVVFGSVFFTSYDDEQLGTDTNTQIVQTPRRGDWGGIRFQNDLDKANGRFDYEDSAVFLNYVNQADMRFGGGIVNLNSVPQVVTPIQMVDSRPTISYNTITTSADAAMSGNPDSFAETSYHAPVFQEEEFFTSDIDRVGPEIHGNHLVSNTVNGLFVGIDTPAGSQLETLNVAGRWDDTDIVHVVAENLIINGEAGSLTIDPGVITKLDGTRIECPAQRADIGRRIARTGGDLYLFVR